MVIKIIKKILRIITIPNEIWNFNKWYKKYINTQLYLCADGIGDVVWFMAYWKQYTKKNNINNYKIITSIRLKEIFNRYGEENLLDSSEVNTNLIILLWKKNKLYKYPNLHVVLFPQDFGKHGNKIIEKYRANIGIMMDDYYRFGCFDLSYEIEESITLPLLIETDFELKTKKNILLIPYTKSRINISLVIWETIAKSLKEKGYTVYTNVGTPKEKPINGTIPLITKIIELPAILRKYDFISICGRCGLADWLFVNECKQIIVHSCKRHPQNKYELLCSSVDRKDSFKIMKRKCLLNEDNTEDLYLYTDDIPVNYVSLIIQKVSKME